MGGGAGPAGMLGVWKWITSARWGEGEGVTCGPWATCKAFVGAVISARLGPKTGES